MATQLQLTKISYQTIPYQMLIYHCMRNGETLLKYRRLLDRLCSCTGNGSGLDDGLVRDISLLYDVKAINHGERTTSRIRGNIRGRESEDQRQTPAFDYKTTEVTNMFANLSSLCNERGHKCGKAANCLFPSFMA